MPFAKDIKFVSPEHIYSRIKEEMKSYFNTGAVDDLMFPVWTEDALKEFKSTYLPIESACIDMFNGRADLPCDFKLVREVWVTATVRRGPITAPFTFYYQTDCRIHPTFEGCTPCDTGTHNPCGPTSCDTPTPQNVPLPNLCDLHLNNFNGGCLCAAGDQFRVTHKVQSNLMFEFTVQEMIMPSNARTMGMCWKHSPNTRCHSLNTFEILDHKTIKTSFRSGTIYLLYYANPYLDEDGYYEIPDEERFQQYLRHKIKFELYQMLYEQSTTDEAYRIIKDKRDDAEWRMNDWLIKARAEAMARDVWDVQKAIVRSYNKNRRFIIH